MRRRQESKLSAFIHCVTPLLLSLALGATAMAAVNPQKSAAAGRYCTATAEAMFKACSYELQDDYWKGVAVCTNFSDAPERGRCEADNNTARQEAVQLCQDKYNVRRDSCRDLGEARYDPDFDEVLTEQNYASPTYVNRYFPIKIGNRWEYNGGGESVAVEVVNETKLVDEVTCVVVRDLVSTGGFVAEATDDWLAVAITGDVWYCGEEVKDYELFDGDRPQRPELTRIDGSFKVGRENAKSGIQFPGSPQEGRVYLEEFALGNAEDLAEILSTDYSYGEDEELDQFVPRSLARLMCHDDCVVTENTNRNEPGALEVKYYAPGVGLFLSIHPEEGTALLLTGCNVDPKCQQLPIR